MAVGNRLAGLQEEPQPRIDSTAVSIAETDKRLGIRNVFHHGEGNFIEADLQAAGRKHPRDSRMRKPAEHLRLFAESLKRYGAAAVPHELHRNRPGRPLLAAQIHPPHATLGDQPLNRHASEVDAQQRVVSLGGLLREAEGD